MGALFAVLPTRNLGFVHDDRALVENSARLGDLSTLPTALISDLFWLSDGVRPSPYWRPWISLTYYIDQLVGEGAVEWFHAHNAFVVVLLAVAVWRWCGRGWRGAVCSALVVLHPAFVEPLANITARTDLYVALLGTVAVCAPRGVGTLALIGALFSKETAVLIPAFWVLQEVRNGQRWTAALRRAWVGGAVVAGWLLTRAALVGGRSAGWPWEGWGQIPGRLATALARIVAPNGGPRPDMDLSHLPVFPAWVGLLVVVAIAYLCIRLASGSRGRSAVSLAMLLGPLLLTSGLVGPGIRMADGLLAWALVGLGMLLSALPGRALLCFVPIIGVLALGHADRIETWRSPETLWSAALQARPGDPRVQLKAGRVLLPHAPRRSIALSAAIQQHPEPRLRREGHELAARALLLVQRTAPEEQALRAHLRQAAQPGDLEAGWACQARCVWDDGPEDSETPARLEVCRAAISLGHESSDVWNTVGILWASRAEWSLAEAAFQRAAETRQF